MGSTDRQNEAKVAIITGGTSGIGLFLARDLHSKGWRVAVVGRRPEVGLEKAAELDPSGETAVFEQCDVASYASQATMFKKVWARFGRLDLLIANAGGVDSGSWYNFGRRDVGVDDIPPEPNSVCTDSHFKGVMFGTVLATHFMRHNAVPGGKIVTTTSMLGVHPCPSFPEYGAAEAGINHWVRVMAPLLKSKENITINAVMMGPVVTPVMPGLGKAFMPEDLVLPATILKAYHRFIDDDTRTGETVEAAHNGLFPYEVPEDLSGSKRRNMLVYEPWFAWMHGEPSGLEDAMQEPPKGNAEDSGRIKEFEVGM